MRLVGLKVAGFRGFNDEQTIDLDAKLVIYFGPNGSGKTSVGEAIEWLFYGRTIKRVKGDEISKREYEGSYRNTHYHGAVDPFVEAQIKDASGAFHTIRRELNADESSKLTIDGKPVAALKQFGIGNLYDRPLILQHTLQDFIFMKPKTRYEVLSAMLGLEPLIDFRSAVETAKTEFPKSLPGAATAAQNRTGLLVASFNSNPLLQPVARAIGEGKLEEARKQLVQVALGRVPAGTKEEDLQAALNQAKASKERSRLDWGRFSLSPVAIPDSHPGISFLSTLEQHVKEFEERVAEAVQKVAESPRQTVPAEVRQFYELGLNLANKEKETECPFCLRDTLTPERIAYIRKATELVPEAKAPLSSARSSVNDLQSTLDTQWLEAKKMMPILPDDDERQTIEQLVTGGAGQYFASCDVTKKLVGDIEERKRTLDGSIRAVQEALRGGKVPESNEHSLSTALQAYADEIKKLPGVANGYAANFAAIDPLVRGKLSSESDVQFLDLLVRGLKGWKDIGITMEILAIQEELQEIIRQSRAFTESKQKQILGQRDKEIRSWYQLLSGGVAVGYEGMIPGTDNLELRAKTFAKAMMAAPNLSASQLNCIGLAVYLATCTRTGSPFHFVLFDDPIQSMDDEHTEAFKMQVMSRLLTQDCQVILLTHMDKFADAVETLHRKHGPVIYRFEEYTQSGPIVAWKGPEIQKLLNEVRKNKDATNEGFRKQSVQALRQFVETFVKDFHTADTGNPISKKYEDKSWSELRGLLRHCKAFDSSDEALLQNTHDFTSPYLHTDGTLPSKVPPAGHINPHFDAMKNLLDKYKTILGIK